MSLCWYVHERLPQEGAESEFYELFEERSHLVIKNWGMSDQEQARVKEIDARLKEISVNAPIPPKWKRKGADSWMGADLTHCNYILGPLADNTPYSDHSPEQARTYAEGLRDAVREWKRENPGWSRQQGIHSPRFEISTIESAARYLTRWANRGYCIIASY